MWGVRRRLRRKGFCVTRPGPQFIDGARLIGVVHCQRDGREYLAWVSARRWFPLRARVEIQPREERPNPYAP
jgi:hypothetical protein